MPELCRFFGIVITMYHDDHPPPHFHARYAGQQAQFTFDGQLLAGALARRIRDLIMIWAQEHRGELQQCWERVGRGEEPGTIEPLR